MTYSKTYDLYFSLGGACASTQILRYCHLQYASYPFDWLWGATIAERAEILAGEFKSLLDKNSMELVNETLSAHGTNNWRNNANGIEFMHDFHANVSFDAEFDKVAGKYCRRAERLLQQIKTSKRVLALYAERPCDKKQLTTEELSEALEILRKAFPQVHIDLLYLYCDDTISITDAEETVLAEGVSTICFGYNMFNVYAPYEVNLPMAAYAMKAFRISGLHLTGNAVHERDEFMRGIPSASKLMARQKLGIRIARMIMEFEGYYRIIRSMNSLLKHFFKIKK